MHYTSTRRSQHNPLRSMPLFQVASNTRGPSATDLLVGELRNALWAVSGGVAAYEKARVALGKVNRHNRAWHRASQRDAMRALNVARGAMRSNARKIADLQAHLLAMAVPADFWADAGALPGAR